MGLLFTDADVLFVMDTMNNAIAHLLLCITYGGISRHFRRLNHSLNFPNNLSIENYDTMLIEMPRIYEMQAIVQF